MASPIPASLSRRRQGDPKARRIAARDMPAAGDEIDIARAQPLEHRRQARLVVLQIAVDHRDHVGRG